MPRTKAMTTQARELAKSLSPEQMRQLADLLAQEAEKPRIDKREYTRLQRDVKTAYAKLTNAEEKLSALLANSGKANDEINEEINTLRREAERERISSPDTPARRRGRPKKNGEG